MSARRMRIDEWVMFVAASARRCVHRAYNSPNKPRCDEPAARGSGLCVAHGSPLHVSICPGCARVTQATP